MLKLTHDLSTGLGRLARLADELEVLELKANDKFSLDVWMAEEAECGASACAVGWCCTFDWAKDLGLRFGYMVPSFNGHWGWPAVAVFFDLDHDEARHLFYPEDGAARNTCPVAQAAHMKKFLREKGYYDE